MGISADSVAALWNEQNRALTLYARQWCRVPEDVVQEAFLLLVRQAVVPDNPTAWLYRVVRNRAINESRNAGRARRREEAVGRAGQPWFEPSLHDRLDAVEAGRALSELPPDQREAIIARLWGGLGFEEIADLAGLSVSAAYRCYHRGLLVLRERLGVECPKNRSTKG